MPNEHESKTALLATGAEVPLFPAALTLLVLDRLLGDPAGDRELVLRLREASITDRPVAADTARRLADAGLADPDGRVLPVVREVVRAALRGEGRGLYLVTPFVSPWDRTVADLIIARETVRAALPPDQAATLLGHEPAGGTNREDESWVRKLFRSHFRDGGPPPPHAN